MLFTTSWDDGYALDLRVAELLERYGFKGTFYVSPKAQHGEKMLREDMIRLIAERHEVGAHSITHPKLTRLSREAVRAEVRGSKEWVERVTGKECTMFCYPKGDWNAEVRAEVAAAGFRGARTTAQFAFSADDAFALPTSLHATAFPVRKQFRTAKHFLDPLGPLRVRLKPMLALRLPPRSYRSWYDLAIGMFRRAADAHAPFFHLWGHSRELEIHGLWDQFERFLKAVHEHPIPARAGVNGDLVALTAGTPRA